MRPLMSKHANWAGAGAPALFPFGEPASKQVLEPARRQFGAPDGMLDVAVAEVTLDQPGVGTAVGQVVAAGMAEYMRVDGQLVKPCGLGALLDGEHQKPGARRLAPAGESAKILGDTGKPPWP